MKYLLLIGLAISLSASAQGIAVNETGAAAACIGHIRRIIHPTRITRAAHDRYRAKCHF